MKLSIKCKRNLLLKLLNYEDILEEGDTSLMLFFLELPPETQEMFPLFKKKVEKAAKKAMKDYKRVQDKLDEIPNI